jgi:hypothetical protein
MDDDTAYMELVKANNQGELLALEIGIHALAMVGKAQGKKTKGDGLAGYAEEIGKSRPLLTQWVDAAKVHQDLDSKMSYYLNEKTSHLYEISKADSCTWQVLADLLIECDWTVKDTQAAVNRIKSIVLLDWMQPLDGFYREVATVPAYAAEIGKGEVSVTEWTKAASVYVFLSRSCETKELNDSEKRGY